MRYKELAEFYEEASATTKRLEKTEILSKFLKKIASSGKDLDRDILYLLLGDIYPEYDERKIGISHQTAIKAISKATGIDEARVLHEWKVLGDLGIVAKKLTEKKKQSTLQTHVLTTEKVLENLRKLPELIGKGTVGKKLDLITELLSSASPVEALYLIRTLIGDLRIGLKESTIRDSMAKAFFSENKEAPKKIQDVIDKSNDLASVFNIVKDGKIDEFEKIHLEIGKPIKAMLAQKAKNIKEAFEAVGKPAAIEYKYDGFRLIIHKKGDKVIFFTRRLENVTKQFPEVADYVKRYVKGDTFILDSEAVGFNKKTKEYMPFQDISQRIRRKYDIEKLQSELPIEINVFDILYYNGKSLLNEPFHTRTALIKKIIKSHPYKIIHSKQIITSDETAAERFYKQALKDRQEGIMFKNLGAHYQPGSRVGHMLKVKPEERDLDLVITGGEYGTGKRHGWLSSFILSCKAGKLKDEFLEVGKFGTGIKEKPTMVSEETHRKEKPTMVSEETHRKEKPTVSPSSAKDIKRKEKSTVESKIGISFHELTEKIKPYFLEEKGKSVKIKPKIVVSVTYQEIQKSINYNSGFALRFPRFTALRPDKHPTEAATLDEVKKDFENQKRNWRFG